MASLFYFCREGNARKQAEVFSPDKRIAFSISLHQGRLYYSVSFRHQMLMENSALGLQFLDADFEDNLTSGKINYISGSEDYELVVGKTSKVHHPFNQAILPVFDHSGKSMEIVVRVFNDGVAFRYQFPEQKNWTSYQLIDENSSFRFVNDPFIHALLLPSFTTSHEGVYTKTKLSGLKEDTLMDMPALFECPNKTFVAITEAALLDYAGMYLVRHEGILRTALSPLPGQNKIKVRASLPHQTPWRVIMIADHVAALIESNMLTSLSPPCRISDLSWIRPGKTTFPWWNGDITPDTNFAPGNNFETNKYYIDFCARNHLQYHSVVEYGGHEWYVNDGADFTPGPHADVTRPVPGLDMPRICAYAKEKGVGIRVWVYWTALYKKLDSAFAVFENWGLSGMMVDFMDRDDQEMVNIQEEILRKAAQHHLHIQFHGAYKPTGLSRTYPNEYTREGTLNYEADKWNDEGISPDHDLNIVFTRMLAGSTDYHLGGFRAVPVSQFKVQYTRPLVLGTRCHMLAMYVVLENYLGMVCDYPAAYEGQPGFDFITTVPTTWDETRVLDAKIDEYIVVARRKGNDWFIGAINNHEARTLDLPLSFLGAGNYQASSYTDSADCDQQPNHINLTKELTSGEKLIHLRLASGGGAAFWLKKQ
ncbi:MAG: glycoside hydrolase family 97 protein [Flavisolibacter sp.]